MTSFCSVLYMLIYHVASFLYRGMYKDSFSSHLVRGIHPRICTESSLLLCLAASLPSWWFVGCDLELCYSIFSCCRCWLICVGVRHCCQPSGVGLRWLDMASFRGFPPRVSPFLVFYRFGLTLSVCHLCGLLYAGIGDFSYPTGLNSYRVFKIYVCFLEE
jgi:hypothetical protein